MKKQILYMNSILIHIMNLFLKQKQYLKNIMRIKDVIAIILIYYKKIVIAMIQIIIYMVVMDVKMECGLINVVIYIVMWVIIMIIKQKNVK